MTLTTRLLVGMTLFALFGCDDSDERYNVGYSDGYAVGYNTACQIRATLVEGDYGNADYARGFAYGQTDGIIACNAGKKP